MGEEEDEAEAQARWVADMGVAEVAGRLRGLTVEHLRGNEGRMLVRRWAELDPSEASRWVTQLGDAEACQELSSAVALVRSERDLAGALDWAYSLPGGDTRTRVLTELGYEMARVDAVESMRLAVELSASDSRNGLLLHALRQWAGQDPGGAAAWAEQVADPSLKNNLLANLAAVWGETAPVAAATLALYSISPGRQQDDAVVGIVQRWVQKEPETTAAWVERFPEGDLKWTAVENVVKIWAEGDAQQVGAWLSGLPAGAMKDTAVAVFSGWLIPASSAAAAEWAKSIGDPVARQRLMELVARSGHENLVVPAPE
jgi:hypothetical protein